MRLFTAFNLSQEVKNKLQITISKLKNIKIYGNYSTIDNLHITLVFIGETNQCSKVIIEMDKIESPAFDIKISQLGIFHRKFGDILWAGLEENPALQKLQEKLHKAIGNIGFSIENRTYNPHITLGRKIILPNNFQIAKLNEQNLNISTSIDCFSLMKSEHIDGKLIYTEIHKKTMINGAKNE
jgi:2''-5'' RNA ligase